MCFWIILHSASSRPTAWARNVKVILLESELYSTAAVEVFPVWNVFLFDGVAPFPGPCWAAQRAWERKDNIGETP